MTSYSTVLYNRGNWPFIRREKHCLTMQLTQWESRFRGLDPFKMFFLCAASCFLKNLFSLKRFWKTRNNHVCLRRAAPVACRTRELEHKRQTSAALLHLFEYFFYAAHCVLAMLWERFHSWFGNTCGHRGNGKWINTTDARFFLGIAARHSDNSCTVRYTADVHLFDTQPNKRTWY